MRVRQNLVLVLGLQGKFEEAETTARKDLPPEAAARSVADIKAMMSEGNRWDAIREGGQSG